MGKSVHTEIAENRQSYKRLYKNRHITNLQKFVKNSRVEIDPNYEDAKQSIALCQQQLKNE